jgi:hypothetical protein
MIVLKHKIGAATKAFVFRTWVGKHVEEAGLVIGAYDTAHPTTAAALAKRVDAIELYTCIINSHPVLSAFSLVL